MYHLAIALHLSGAFLLVGGALHARIVRSVMLARGDAASVEALFEAYKRVPAMTIPGALISILSGTYLAWTLGYPATSVWLALSYALWLVAMITSGGVIKPAVDEIQRALASERRTPETLREALNGRRLLVGTAIADLCTVSLIVLMILKPGM